MKNNIYFLTRSFFILLLFFLFLLPLHLFAQSLAPIPGVGPTVCAANCDGNTNPTIAGSSEGIGDFCRVESDCKSGLRCVPTRACAAGCIACNGSSATTCQRLASSCIFRGKECSIAQGRFCCRGLTCISEVVGNGRVVSRCKRSCR